jgi:hypothetical protein
MAQNEMRAMRGMPQCVRFSEGLGVELFGAIDFKRPRQRGLQLQRSMPLPKRPKT